MVWGESGGGAKTAAIYTMPAAARLFHKASIESAAPLRFPARDGATARARRTLELLGLATADIPTLHDIPAERLLEIQQSEAANGVASFSAGKPLMCGACRDETVFFSLFGPRDIFRVDEAGRRSGAAPVFMYQLAYRNPTLVPGTDSPSARRGGLRPRGT
jgi:para-nitrobenzyl esterase